VEDYTVKVTMTNRNDGSIVTETKTFGCGSDEWAVRYILQDYKRLYSVREWKIKAEIVGVKPSKNFRSGAGRGWKKHLKRYKKQ